MPSQATLRQKLLDQPLFADKIWKLSPEPWPLSEAQAQRWLADMRRVFPDVRPGDRIAGLHLPGQSARFWQDGRPLGEVADAEFGRRFFGVWLAPTTSQPAMRLSLLGLAASGSL
jgi:hypothetical protein